MGADNVDDLIEGYVDKLLSLVGVEIGRSWKHEELD